MSKLKKIISLVLVLVLFGSVLVVTISGWVFSESSAVEVFGYNVYKFEGSGHYAIFYPLPNGSVRLLKRGEVGVLPVFVKIPRKEWIKEYSKSSSALKALPAPLLVFVNDKGLGFATLRGSKVTLKSLQIPNKPKTTGLRTCPSGYIPFGSRYCIPQNPDTTWIKPIASKTITESLSISGLEVDNSSLEETIFSVWLVFYPGASSYWTVGVDAGNVTITGVEPGELFKGKTFLDIDYYTPGSVNSSDSTWSRYVNLFVKYQVVVLGVLAYNRYTGKFTRIPVTATYPLEILSTGRYTIYETQNGTKYAKGNYSYTFAPKITSKPNYYKIPSSANTTRKYIHANGNQLIAYIYSGSTGYHMAVPLGTSAVNFLMDHGLHGRADSLFLTFDVAIFDFEINANPRQDCHVFTYTISAETPDNSSFKIHTGFIRVR